jgi:hypothetical protein
MIILKDTWKFFGRPTWWERIKWSIRYWFMKGK